MKPMGKAELDAIRKRCEKASRGPWRVANEGYYVDAAEDTNICETHSEADSSFIAHARTDIPDLLAEIDRLQGETEDLVRCRECLYKGNCLIHEAGQFADFCYCSSGVRKGASCVN